MSPYTPYLALPIALSAAWFFGSEWSGSSPGRYRVPPVVQLQEPAEVLSAANTNRAGQPDIRVSALLPRTPPTPRPPSPTLILHSVMTGADVNLASINGKLVKEGDSIEGYRVRRIAADGVELSSAGGTRRLRMRSLHELAAAGNRADESSAGTGGDDARDSYWAKFDSQQEQQ